MIPKILHYCFGMAPDFGGKPWSLVHYACLRSAAERIRPDKIFFYYEHEPGGAWWELTRRLVTPVKIVAPREIFGNPLSHPAHRADVVRLEKLLEQGGIYLDADVFVHRSFDDLLGHRTVLGAEGPGARIGLCNAVILSEANAPFLRRWYEEYRSFRSRGVDEFWNEHSVKIPLRLARDHPDEITILPHTAFFWPTWEAAGLEALFRSREPLDISAAYANHLWETPAWDRYLNDLTPGQVRAVESNFHRWVRPFTAELSADFGLLPTTQRVVRDIRRGGWGVLRGAGNCFNRLLATGFGRLSRH